MTKTTNSKKYTTWQCNLIENVGGCNNNGRDIDISNKVGSDNSNFEKSGDIDSGGSDGSNWGTMVTEMKTTTRTKFAVAGAVKEEIMITDVAVTTAVVIVLFDSNRG